MLTVPALQALHASRPDLKIDFWSQKEHFELLNGKPFIGRFHSCHGPELSPFFDTDSAAKAPVPPFFLDASEIFIFGQKSSRILASNLAGRLGCPVRRIQSFPAPETDSRDAASSVHVFDFLKEQLENLGWPVEPGFANLEARADERSIVRKWMAERGITPKSKPVLIHPGSGGRKKIWPLPRWWDLLFWIKGEYKLPVVMSLGPADDYLIDFAGEVERLGVQIIRDIPLTRLAAFLAESRLYIGNDSGVSHLAASLGVPTVAVFGPTNPTVWAPRGPRVRVVRGRWDESEVLARPFTACNQQAHPEALCVREAVIEFLQ